MPGGASQKAQKAATEGAPGCLWAVGVALCTKTRANRCTVVAHVLTRIRVSSLCGRLHSDVSDALPRFLLRRGVLSEKWRRYIGRDLAPAISVGKPRFRWASDVLRSRVFNERCIPIDWRA